MAWFEAFPVSRRRSITVDRDLRLNDRELGWQYVPIPEYRMLQFLSRWISRYHLKNGARIIQGRLTK